MSMTKIICSLHWTPAEPLKKHLEENRDLIVPVFGGGRECGCPTGGGGDLRQAAQGAASG